MSSLAAVADPWAAAPSRLPRSSTFVPWSAPASVVALLREGTADYGVAPARGTPRPRVLVVSGSFAVVARLQRGLGAALDLVPRATVEDGGAALAAGPVAALVLEAEDARGTPTAGLALRARSGPPRIPVPVVAVVRRATGWSAAALALIETRPAAVVVAEDLDLTSVVRAIGARLGRAAFVEAVWPEVERVVPAGLLPLARLALERGGAPLRVPEAARALGLHRKTLWSQCRRHGVESAQALLMWCRVLAAAHALRTSGRSVDAVAQELEFASPTALRNVLRRYLGVTATELRLQGGEALACRAFAAWLARGAATTRRGLVCEGDAAARGVTRGDGA